MATYEEIRNKLSKPTTGIVDSLLKSTASRGVSVGQAFQPGTIPKVDHSEARKSVSDAITSVGEFFKKPKINEDGSVTAHKPGKGSPFRGGKRTKGGYETYPDMDSYLKQKKHEEMLKTNPYFEEQDDGSIVYGSSVRALEQNKLKHLEKERKHTKLLEKQEQIKVNKQHIQNYIDKGFSQERAELVASYHSKSLEDLLKNKQDILNSYFKQDQYGDLDPNISDVTRRIYAKKLQDLQSIIELKQSEEQKNLGMIQDIPYWESDVPLGPGLPEGGKQEEYQGPYSNEWYDEQKGTDPKKQKLVATGSTSGEGEISSDVNTTQVIPGIVSSMPSNKDVTGLEWQKNMTDKTDPFDQEHLTSEPFIADGGLISYEGQLYTPESWAKTNEQLKTEYEQEIKDSAEMTPEKAFMQYKQAIEDSGNVLDINLEDFTKIHQAQTASQEQYTGPGAMDPDAYKDVTGLEWQKKRTEEKPVEVSKKPNRSVDYLAKGWAKDDTVNQEEWDKAKEDYKRVLTYRTKGWKPDKTIDMDKAIAMGWDKKRSQWIYKGKPQNKPSVDEKKPAHRPKEYPITKGQLLQ